MKKLTKLEALGSMGTSNSSLTEEERVACKARLAVEKQEIRHTADELARDLVSARHRTAALAPDLVSAAGWELAMSIDSFDRTKGVPFECYAKMRMGRAIKKAQQKLRARSKRFVTGKVLVVAQNDSNELADCEYVENLFQHLAERESEILRMRFWENRSDKDIAEKLGLSRERVRQIAKKSLETLKNVIQARNAEDSIIA